MQNQEIKLLHIIHLRHMIHEYNYSYSNAMETGTLLNLLLCVWSLKYKDYSSDSIYVQYISITHANQEKKDL